MRGYKRRSSVLKGEKEKEGLDLWTPIHQRDEREDSEDDEESDSDSGSECSNLGCENEEVEREPEDDVQGVDDVYYDNFILKDVGQPVSDCFTRLLPPTCLDQDQKNRLRHVVKAALSARSHHQSF